MNKFKAILVDSFWEVRSGKMLYIYGVVTIFTALVFAIIPDISIGGQELNYDDPMASGMVGEITDMFYGGFIGFMIFLIYLGTTWMVPAFLKKGRVELTLSKPINRINLISMKFVSLYLISIAILTIVSLVVWFVISIRMTGFNSDILPTLLAGYAEFFVIFAIIFAFGVITRSGAFALMAYFILKIVSGLLVSREMVYQFLKEGPLTKLVDVLYHILPKFSEMSESLMMYIEDSPRVDYYPIWSTILFAVALYAITILVFQRRDY